ncbi:MAG: hypothetical protein KJ050_16325, partial [Candidatus Omnitrophica bacterium]|nr:hypothetical protein [Candidatus Omnitrophota bacterium]
RLLKDLTREGECDCLWVSPLFPPLSPAHRQNVLKEPVVGATFMAPENPNPQTVILAKAGIYSRCHWIPAFAGKTMEGVGMAMEGSGNAERPSPPAECVERACCRGDIHGARKSQPTNCHPRESGDLFPLPLDSRFRGKDDGGGGNGNGREREC